MILLSCFENKYGDFVPRCDRKLFIDHSIIGADLLQMLISKMDFANCFFVPFFVSRHRLRRLALAANWARLPFNSFLWLRQKNIHIHIFESFRNLFLHRQALQISSA